MFGSAPRGGFRLFLPVPQCEPVPGTEPCRPAFQEAS